MSKWKRPRGFALPASVAGILVAAGLLGAAVYAAIPPPPADSGCGSIEVPNNGQSATCTTNDGAIVDYIGSSANNQSSGTGIFDPFVRLQASPDEEGFNTNAAVTLDAKAGSWTHAILVSAIPVVTINGTRYWELFNDINESNSTKPISLNKVEIYFAPGPGGANITGYPGFAGFSATLVYAFDGDILINDVNQGSGRGDLRYLVPLTNIPTPPAGTYFVLYSEWGTTSTAYNSDGGFEEWKVRRAPNVSIVKTADAASVNAGSNIGFTITVTNSGAADATGVTINDPLPSGSGIDWVESPDNPNCTIGGSPPNETLTCGPVTLAAGGGTLSVHVQSATTAASCGLYDNTATFTSTNAGSGSDDASVTVNCAAIAILKKSTKSGNPLVANAGAVFSVDGPDAGTTPDFSITDDTTAAAPDEDALAGAICISGLAPGNYTINETTPPPGYGGATQTNVTAVAVTGTNCSANKPTAANSAVFTNVPLGEITAGYHDLGSGETSATSITCAPSGGANLTAQAEASDDDIPNNGGGSYNQDSTFNVTAPGTYVCTLVVDP